MDKPGSHSIPAKRINAGEAWNEIGRKMGIDFSNLPDAHSLPPWTEEEAAAFERNINEMFGQIEEPPDTRP